MKLKMNITNRGFTIIEVLAVLAVIGIVSALISPQVFSTVDNSKIVADKVGLESLNKATYYYGISKANDKNDVFEGLTTDTKRIQTLIDNKYIEGFLEPMQRDFGFYWNIEDQEWLLKAENQLSPLGSTFQENSTAMIELIRNYYAENNRYGSKKPQKRYTDLGLKPEDWQAPVNHIYYIPGGSKLKLTPEEGYSITVLSVNGDKRVLKNKGRIFYDDKSKKWHFKNKSKKNILNIATLAVTKD